MTRTVAITALLLALAAPTAGRADVYAWRDADGVIHLTDRPSHKGYRLVMRTGKGGALKPVKPTSGGKSYGGKGQYGSLISKTARRYAIEEELLHAVVAVESAYDAGAVSRTGAVGLMQLMPETASRYGVKNPWNPEDNLDGGARYLRDLLERFRSLPLALAAYNAGENAVTKYGNKIPPFPETKQYVSKVMSHYRNTR